MTQMTWRVDATGTMAPAGTIAAPGHADGVQHEGLRTGDALEPDSTLHTRTRGDVILDLQHISLAFGGVKALTDISFDVCEHEIRAIIGPNGAGKSSMLNVINGVYHPQQGRIVFRGEERRQMHPTAAARQGIARTFQNIALFKGMTVLDNIMTGRNTQFRTGLFAHALWWGPARAEEIRHRHKVEEVIDFLEIQAIRKTPVGRLPYGLQKRVELARALAAEPSMLLLDEPMAGMNVEEKQDMCRFILDVNQQFGTTIVLIEHDMGVVMDISDRVVVLDYGKKIGDGTPEEVKANPDVIRAYLGTSH
ncbi:Lipopolysaccharide export system ATP-binding protein LptB [Cupriavidus campinensis]|uniref:ABC transporter ATP-binding protein n=1 Tax=Cupriavidus campinensis TaxID=151783 RepID=A0AAE9L235_9BURK|nr:MULTISPECIES: ABC transporter ATP-binding protein [Cupriavidus]TSP11635.1 ABC transporter ATP-binding protein [Cupriavidus campinensis]URF04513.1 ABC transporter ATP-binding protein [Cupriavidus campinensis]CAG2140123.1 Lipopolysaccharide export system ATP-binding protein LptB [Cupriavidus campinensis]